VDITEITPISFNPNKMEFLISFTSGDISEDKEQETLNLGQAQILMDISQEKGSLVAIKVLLPTPLVQEAMNVLKNQQKNQNLKSYQIDNGVFLPSSLILIWSFLTILYLIGLRFLKNLIYYC
jgi:hypothetical protein